MNKLLVIGIGPGNSDYVLPVASKAIESCQLLLGGKRNLDSFPQFQGEKLPLGADLMAAVEIIKSRYHTQQVGMILSGDTGFYSMLDFLRKYFEDQELEVIPGLSSFQYLFGKIKRPWYDTTLLSVHGRQTDYLTRIKQGESITLLTDRRQSPEVIAHSLIQEGFGDLEMIVGENLSYPEERIVRGRPEAILAQGPYHMAVVVIINE